MESAACFKRRRRRRQAVRGRLRYSTVFTYTMTASGRTSNVIIGPDGYLYGTSQGLIFATTSLGTVFAVKE